MSPSSILLLLWRNIRGSEVLFPIEDLRGPVREALQESRISQASAARRLSISQKYLSQMLTGKAPLSPEWAAKLLELCGLRIYVCFASGPPDDQVAELFGGGLS